MSDLIGYLQGFREHLLNLQRGANINVRLDLSELDTILSALKMVRGIEGITNTEGNSVLFVHKNADFNGLPNCCIVVTTDWNNEQIYRANTFAECVEGGGGGE